MRNVATNAGTAVVGLTNASSANVGLRFLVGAGFITVDPDELLMLKMEASSSEGGAEYPVGYAITS